MSQITMFDLPRWIKENNIQVRLTGKNVSKNWIGINCPFCAHDTDKHLGVNKKTKAISCWKCQTKGSIVTLLKALYPDTNIQKILDKYTPKNKAKQVEISTVPDKNFATSCKLPRNSSPKLMELHKNYLKSRKFNANFLYKKYRLRSVGIDASWGYRIIIPIYHRGKLMSFTARDVSGKSKIRYLACPIEKSVLDPKSLVYNIDSATDRLIIVEGASDVWRIGDGCVAMMGVGVSKTQIKTIVARKFQKIFILFDNDDAGNKESAILGNTLAQYADTEILALPDDVADPGDLDRASVKILRNQVFGKIY